MFHTSFECNLDLFHINKTLIISLFQEKPNEDLHGASDVVVIQNNINGRTKCYATTTTNTNSQLPNSDSGNLVNKGETCI